MITVILAGGKGSRILEETRDMLEMAKASFTANISCGLILSRAIRIF